MSARFIGAMIARLYVWSCFLGSNLEIFREYFCQGAVVVFSGAGNLGGTFDNGEGHV